MKRLFSVISLSAAILSVCSCGGGYSNGVEFLDEFHRAYFMSMSQNNAIEDNNLALYVDYSTCVAQAMKYDETGSRFYQALVPPLTHETKHYFSIKGSQINEEQGDVFSLLRTVQEVNYADLATAVNLIANGTSEAVLLTDGEYFQQSIALGNINNPYMTDAFKTWLKKGHDIYVFAEPYKETNKGKVFNKKRFYFIFTDCRIENNIFDVIQNNVNIEMFPEVQYYHLTASNPRLTISENAVNTTCSTPNTNLGITPDAHGDFEVQDWQGWRWKDISEYIMNAYDQKTGNPLPNGDPIIYGLGVDKNFNGGCYRIEDVELVISDVNEAYNNFYNQMYEAINNNGLSMDDNLYPYAFEIAKNNKIKCDEIKNFMLLDEDEYKNHGDIIIYFNKEMFYGDFLCMPGYNYFKIDINVKRCTNNFSNNPYAQSIFEFDSIDYPGQMNTSIVESIKLAISDPQISNMVKGKTLYTIYVACEKY